MAVISEFEIVDFVPQRKKSRYAQLNIELIQTLLKVPPGKSLRRGLASIDEAKSYATAVRIFLKNKESMKPTL